MLVVDVNPSYNHSRRLIVSFHVVLQNCRIKLSYVFRWTQLGQANSVITKSCLLSKTKADKKAMNNCGSNKFLREFNFRNYVATYEVSEKASVKNHSDYMYRLLWRHLKAYVHTAT